MLQLNLIVRRSCYHVTAEPVRRPCYHVTAEPVIRPCYQVTAEPVRRPCYQVTAEPVIRYCYHVTAEPNCQKAEKTRVLNTKCGVTTVSKKKVYPYVLKQGLIELNSLILNETIFGLFGLRNLLAVIRRNLFFKKML
jgi:hypothetical protein